MPASARSRRTSARRFKRGETREIMGLGVSFFTEIVGAGHVEELRHSGIAMFDSCEIRLHPTGAGIARVGTKSTGQGHETTWAQIIATEIAFPPTISWSRKATPTPRLTGSAPTGRARRRWRGARSAMAARKIKAKAQMIAAYKLEVHEGDLEWISTALR